MDDTSESEFKIWDIQDVQELETALDWKQIEDLIAAPPEVQDIVFSSRVKMSNIVNHVLRVEDAGTSDAYDPEACDIAHVLSVAINNHRADLYDERTHVGMLVSVVMANIRVYMKGSRTDGFPGIAIEYNDDELLRLMYDHKRCAFEKNEMTVRLLDRIINDEDESMYIKEDCTNNPDEQLDVAMYISEVTASHPRYGKILDIMRTEMDANGVRH